MALSVGNVVLLAIGATLLATGAARAALYVMPPEPSPQAVYQRNPGPFQPAAAEQSPERISPTRLPLPASSANTTAAVPTLPPPQTTPNAVPPDTSKPLAGQGVAGSPEKAEPSSPETEIGIASATVPVADAMAPLGDKFARVWHWVQETGEFIYYDPLVPEESTLKSVASGQTYLILVTESVTLVVNGQELELVCDDGDCWNRVVWP